jgi:repressor LexA
VERTTHWACSRNGDPLTARQHEALAYIADYTTANGYPPTFRELCKGLGMSSTNAANDHLKALEKKGYIERKALASRAIRVTPAGRDALHTRTT